MELESMRQQVEDAKKQELGYWLIEFTKMSLDEFLSIDQSSFTVIQRIAYNYAEEAQTSSKIADKIVKVINEYNRLGWH